MKFNWGTGIFIFLIIFFVFIFSFIYYATKQKVNLVEDNYYEKELAFQDQIDKNKNTEPFKDLITFIQLDGMLKMTFPESLNSRIADGNIHFYRPSDYEKDVIIPLELDTLGTQYFDSSLLEKGRYVIKLSWSIDSVDYYLEKPVFIQ